MVIEKRSLTVMWNNVRNMKSRVRPSERMDWIERSNCDVCAVRETGLTGVEFMEHLEVGVHHRSGLESSG